MKLGTRKLEAVRNEEMKPVAEMNQYYEAAKRQAKIDQELMTLQGKGSELTERLSAARTQLEAERAKKSAMTRGVALGEVAQTEYDLVKRKIGQLVDEVEELVEQVAVIDGELGKMSKKIVEAGQALQGARYNVIHAIIAREAAEIRELVGAKVWELCCLAAQAGIPGYAQQLEKIFPDMPFDVRLVETDRAMRQLFTVGE